VGDSKGLGGGLANLQLQDDATNDNPRRSQGRSESVTAGATAGYRSRQQAARGRWNAFYMANSPGEVILKGTGVEALLSRAATTAAGRYLFKQFR